MRQVYQFIIVEHLQNVTVVTLNRPQRYNVWNRPMRAEMVSIMRELNRDYSTHTIVITGAGDKAFSAGQDLSEMEQFSPEQIEHWLDELRDTYAAIRMVEKPIVAALNGVAAGFGFQVALLCDVRVGHPESRMGQPEINAGIPSTFGPWLMRLSLGMSRTVELILTGRMMEANECYQIGLMHHLVPREQVFPKAVEVARDLAGKPEVAMRLDKRRFREVTEEGFQASYIAAKRIQRDAFATNEPQTMMARFFAERRAHKQSPLS